MKTRPKFYRRCKFWIFCIPQTIITLIIAVMLTLYVIMPKIARGLMNKATVNFSQIGITISTTTSTDIVMACDMDRTGPVHADISFPGTVTASWNNKALSTTVIPGTSTTSCVRRRLDGQDPADHCQRWHPRMSITVNNPFLYEFTVSGDSTSGENDYTFNSSYLTVDTKAGTPFTPFTFTNDLKYTIKAGESLSLTFKMQLRHFGDKPTTTKFIDEFVIGAVAGSIPTLGVFFAPVFYKGYNVTTVPTPAPTPTPVPSTVSTPSALPPSITAPPVTPSPPTIASATPSPPSVAPPSPDVNPPASPAL
ncbi:hypothetical protein BG015_004767 [Linnemannia schmuckeri]|uniref:Uncharacterized protein n=1 Tax=Linnemannia schmuckeri TaxID=64567 RepID=A0A9P5S432_9FUNG|nr:hypothetical protein BG015_004767 [Linnemannia schmuckeri]